MYKTNETEKKKNYKNVTLNIKNAAPRTVDHLSFWKPHDLIGYPSPFLPSPLTLVKKLENSASPPPTPPYSDPDRFCISICRMERSFVTHLPDR